MSQYYPPSSQWTSYTGLSLASHRAALLPETAHRQDVQSQPPAAVEGYPLISLQSGMYGVEYPVKPSKDCQWCKGQGSSRPTGTATPATRFIWPVQKSVHPDKDTGMPATEWSLHKGDGWIPICEEHVAKNDDGTVRGPGDRGTFSQNTSALGQGPWSSG